MINLNLSDSLSVECFLSYMNASRKKNPDKWQSFAGWVDLMFVEVKFYGLWTQILRIEHITHSTVTEHKTVKSWIAEMQEAFNYHLTKANQ